MADRHRKPKPSRSQRTAAAALAEPPPRPTRGVADEPLIDLIFPNRVAPPERGFEPSTAYVERAQGFGPPLPHRKVGRLRRLFGAGRGEAAPAPVKGRPTRRRVLLGLGTGAVAAAGVGTAVTLVTGGIGAALGGSGGPRRPNTAVDGLGAAGLAGSPTEAAHLASVATPLGPRRWTATRRCTCYAGPPSGRPWSTWSRSARWGWTRGWNGSSTRSRSLTTWASRSASGTPPP